MVDVTADGPNPTIRWFADLHSTDLGLAGGKAVNLAELIRADLPVPPGFVLTTAAYTAFVGDHGIGDAIRQLVAEHGPRASADIAALFAARTLSPELSTAITEAYAQLSEGAPDLPVAIRSSATAEDLAEASFAGQQETYLNVRGSDQVLAAVRDCWASLWTERAISYRQRQGVDDAGIALAVVVQLMVDADAAGVMFTANPANGHRDETVISSALGLGEGVVSGTVDTENVVVGSAGILSRAAPHGSGNVLDDAEALELTRLGRIAESHFGRPQDLEWARSAGRLFLVQSRPITALPDPEGPVPTRWIVPDRHSWYFRASIVEQLPDPLSPLFADLIDRSVGRSLKLLMTDLIKGEVIRDGDVGLPTINGYAYYAYSRGGMIRVTLQTPRALPVLASSGRRSGTQRWREISHPAYAAVVRAWHDRALSDLTDDELIDGLVELLDAGTVYYTSVQTIIPVASTSEVLLTRFYDRFVRRPGDPPASVLVLGSDSVPIRAEKALWDLARWAAEHPDLTGWLRAHAAAEIVATDVPPAADGVDPQIWQQWIERLGQHLEHYGHLIYNLDFVNPVPAEAPEPLVETVRYYLGGGGTDPYVRQAGLVSRRDQLTRDVRDRLGPLRRGVFDRLSRWARGAAPVREDALADVGLAWPLLRRIALEVGGRLVARGSIAQPDQVFWLHRAEIEVDLALDRAVSRASLIDRRKALWRGRRRAVPPQVLPRTRMTSMFDSMLPAVSGEQNGDVIRGLGASGGRITGTARVLAGPGDFDQLQPGDILVAAITTPAWTSLFARAGGIVTDIGGPLSHSSIVAREYGLPAVLGTGVATRRLHSGQRITVDGDDGTVRVVEDAAATVPPAIAK